MLPLLIFNNRSLACSCVRESCNKANPPGIDSRQGCLSGFARAEECADVVGQRVLEVLLSKKGRGAVPAILIHWLEMELVPSDDELDL